MTTIRNQTISLTSNQAGSAASSSVSHGDSGHADPSTSPFAALLQRHVDPDAGSTQAAGKSASVLNQAAAQTAASREHDAARAQPSERSRTAATPEYAAQHEAAREGAHEGAHEVAHEADRSASKTAARPAASKAPAKTADKPAKTDGSKTASDGTDDEAADTAATSASTDPLAAWLAALQGGAAAPDTARAAAEALPAAGGKAQAALRAPGETPLQAVDAKDVGLTGEPAGARQALKADDASGFAASLSGAGRAGDAAGANALGLAAVRMLGSGGDATALQNLAQQTAEQPAALSAGSMAAPDASAQAAALHSLAGAGAVPTHGTDAPTVAAPVGSPAFAGELADQVQVLVSKASLEAAAAGVHEARLNLNPAEMGPISIRISLDGNQAQVDFAAASGATRQALQDSMPALASALDGAGLTLSGGGVSQEFAQARQDQAQQPGAGPVRSALSRGSDADAAGGVQDLSAAAGSWVRRPEGKLDLYA